MTTNLNSIVNDISQYLNHQIEEGQTNTEISQEIMEKLTKPQKQKITTEQKTYPVAPKPAPVTPKQPPVAPQAEATTVQAKPEPTTPVPVNTENLSGMDKIAVQINQCTKCSLCKVRTNTVPGQGSNTPEIMFIGEAPGAKEDEQGIPFVGRSGVFLTKMITAMGYSREEIFIGNILKCRPPENRKPTAEETELCIPYLKQQIAILKPKVIISLGSTSVKGLLGKTPAISKLRGEWQKFEGIPLMPTFHPAYILRNQSKKGELWSDLKKVLAFMGKTPPPIKKS